MSWSLRSEHIDRYAVRGFLKFGSLQEQKLQAMMIYYLTSGYVQAAERGEIADVGTIASPKWVHRAAKGMKPMTMWAKVSHDAGWHGSRLLDKFIPGRSFPFAKSLFAVEDALRFFISTNPYSTVVDFFSGSGTTAHAVMRLNKQDGGRRVSISVTNNEVSAEEQKKLREQELRPGDPEWERWGICDYVTKPRIEAAVSGKTPHGEPIKGDYKFTDVFPIADGFEENVGFFTMTYEAPLRVAAHRDFPKIAPLLWLRAGSRGRRIEDLTEGWAVADTYGVVADLDKSEPFLKAIAASSDITHAFVITDEDRLFESIVRDLPDHVEPVRMYDAYLRNFELESRVLW
jgi:adenine-specific DNA-methyltransferase